MGRKYRCRRGHTEMPTYRGCQGVEELVRQEAKRRIQDPRIQQGNMFQGVVNSAECWQEVKLNENLNKIEKWSWVLCTTLYYCGLISSLIDMENNLLNGHSLHCPDSDSIPAIFNECLVLSNLPRLSLGTNSISLPCWNPHVSVGGLWSLNPCIFLWNGHWDDLASISWDLGTTNLSKWYWCLER